MRPASAAASRSLKGSGAAAGVSSEASIVSAVAVSMPVTRLRSASATSRMLRASINCTCCRDRRASTLSTSFGASNPAARMFRTSRRCASTSVSASSTTRTDSVAVTSAQNARAASSRTSAVNVATSLPAAAASLRAARSSDSKRPNVYTGHCMSTRVRQLSGMSG